MNTITKRLSWRTKADQFYQSFGCGQIHTIRFMGTCESCGRSVYSHGCSGARPCGDTVDCSPDPRGTIPPEHCMNLYRAREYNLAGRDVMTCAACADDGERYRALMTAVKDNGTWKEAEPMNEHIEMMLAQGWKVYKRPAMGISKGEYCYCTDGTGIAYAQWSDDRPSVSTVHYPNKQTGTGFQFADRITPETIRAAMDTVAPDWARSGDAASVRKYKDWAEFHNSDDWNKGLEEVTA